MVRFRNPRQSKSVRPARRFSLDLLEQRICLHGETAVLTDGVLAVAGDPHFGDSIAIVMNDQSQTIDIYGAHGVQRFGIDSVQMLRIDSLGGDDLIQLDRSLRLPMSINGGDGIDTVLGWSGSDPLSAAHFHGIQYAGDSTCIGVECFSLPPGVTIAEEEESSKSDAIASVLGLIDPLFGAHAGHGSAGGSFTAAVTSHATMHGAHNLTDAVIGLDFAASHGHSPFISAASGQASRHAAHAVAAVAAVGHAAMGHAFGESAQTGSTDNYEFATKSPYAGECPSSNSLAKEANTTAEFSTLGATDQSTSTPKVGCKCLAMQKTRTGSEPNESDPAVLVREQTDHTTPANPERPAERVENQKARAVSESEKESCCSKKGAPAATESQDGATPTDIMDEAIRTLHQTPATDDSADDQQSSVLDWRSTVAVSTMTVAYFTSQNWQRARRRKSMRDSQELSLRN